jgi:hypothetical protein
VNEGESTNASGTKKKEKNTLKDAGKEIRGGLKNI